MASRTLTKKTAPEANGHVEAAPLPDRNKKAVSIPQLVIGRAEIELVGTTSLIVSRFGEKAKRQMEDKQQKKATKAREARDPHADYLSSMYIISGDRSKPDSPKTIHGLPASGFKKAMATTANLIGASTGAAAKRMFKIIGHPIDPDLVELTFDRVFMRGPDPVRNANGTCDLRYRAEYEGWRVKFLVQHNPNLISLEEIINLLFQAGEWVGWGELRSEKGFNHGNWTVGGAMELAKQETTLVFNAPAGGAR